MSILDFVKHGSFLAGAQRDMAEVLLIYLRWPSYNWSMETHHLHHTDSMSIARQKGEDYAETYLLFTMTTSLASEYSLTFGRM